MLDREDRAGIHGVRERRIDGHVVAQHQAGGLAERPARPLASTLVCAMPAVPSNSPSSLARRLPAASSGLPSRMAKRWSCSASGCSRPTTLSWVASGSASKAARAFVVSLSCIFQRRPTGARTPPAMMIASGPRVTRRAASPGCRRWPRPPRSGRPWRGRRRAGSGPRPRRGQDASTLEDAGQQTQRVAHRRAWCAAGPGTWPVAVRHARATSLSGPPVVTTTTGQRRSSAVDSALMVSSVRPLLELATTSVSGPPKPAGRRCARPPRAR